MKYFPASEIERANDAKWLAKAAMHSDINGSSKMTRQKRSGNGQFTTQRRGLVHSESK